MRAIFQREFRAYFTSPIGCLLIGAFSIVCGLYFNYYTITLGNSEVYQPLSNALLILVLLVPILTMRLLAEERGSKTDQLLLTAPVTVWSIVFGKYLAAICVFLLAMATTLPYLVIIAIHGAPVWGQIWMTYLGFLLIGMAFIAIGVWVSSMTESQILAAVASLGILLAMFLSGMIGQTGIAVVDRAIDYVQITGRFEDFAMGILNLENLIYYLSIVALFLFLTVRGIEKRRWS